MSAPCTACPQVLETWKRATSACELRVRTGGLYWNPSMSSRAGGPIWAIETTLAPIGQPFAVAETAAVGVEVANVRPNWFLACTRTRIAWPTSAEVSVYVWLPAPVANAH